MHFKQINAISTLDCEIENWLSENPAIGKLQDALGDAWIGYVLAKLEDAEDFDGSGYDHGQVLAALHRLFPLAR